MNANRDKGIRAELALAKFLRAWFPGAERSVAAGFKTSDPTRAAGDRGDIRDAFLPTHPIAWQCKDVVGSHPKGLSGKALRELLYATRTQRDVAGAVLGILVEKRAGHGSASTWWAHLDAAELAALHYRRWFPGCGAPLVGVRGPVRLELLDLMMLLEHAGLAPVPTGEEDMCAS